MTGPLTDALAVAVVLAFGGGWALDASGRRRPARLATVGAWVLFAAFWAALVPHFALEQRSIVEGVGAAVAVPASLYVGLLLYRGRDSLLTISRGIAVMGAVYLPFQLLPALTRPAIQLTTLQSEVLVRALGYDPTMIRGSELGERLGVENTFLFATGGARYSTEVLLACTGLGSISIFAGLVAAVRAPLRRKAVALAIVVPVIYALNLLRVTFIALAHGRQWFRGGAIEGPVLWLFGVSNENLVSFLVADRIISQSLSVLVLVAIALAVLRVLPQLVVVFEDVLFVATGNEYDLAGALGPDVRPDGGDGSPGERHR